MPSTVKQKAPKRGHPPISSDRAASDSRFAHLHTDPRFRLPSRKHSHVKLDKRFSHMLKDDNFARKAQVDRYGRPLARDAGRKELERFYSLGKEKEDEEDEDEADEDEDVQNELERIEAADEKYDPARHGGFGSSEEESSSESDDEDEADVEDDDLAEAEDAPDVPMGEVSRRIAVVNLDWDNIRASDLMAVAQSFCPPAGRIQNVTVYPSEFGRDRMQREEMEGPPQELFKTNNKTAKPASDDGFDEESLDEEDDEAIKQRLLNDSTDPSAEVDSKALRAYQLSRLRYYYAVVTCDSNETAHALYKDMDGREYLTSANFFDLRFVPESVTFDDPITDQPRDKCDKVPDGYRPNDFTTEALTHSNVKLTWDEEDPGRKEAQKRAFSRQEIDENDLQAYIGSGSSSEDEEENDTEANGNGVALSGASSTKGDKKATARQKMRALLGLSTDQPTSPKAKSAEKESTQRPSGDMQITFRSGLTNTKDGAGSVFANKPEDVYEETTREKYIRKEKERKERRRAKAKASREGTFTDEAEPPPLAADTEADKAAEPATEETDAFADPFFEDPASANRTARREAKKEKRRLADAKAAREADEQRRAREELSLLMADEGVGGSGGTASHFDMAAIRKQEKEESRKGRKGKLAKKRRASGIEDAGPADDIDVQDPRFRQVFESHEYAIDPTNPRFSGTKGMKKLLDKGREAREKQARTSGVEMNEDAPPKKKKRHAV